MIQHGYYRYPTIHRDTIVFISEDDLWTVPAAGGTARRLTSGLGEATTPFLSPDGRWLAFIGRDEGPPEVYVMPAEGGSAVRRTFQGATWVQVVGWSRDGRSILYWSNGSQPIMRMTKLFSVNRQGGLPNELPYGPANFISFGPKGLVLGKHGLDPARWKRYRGGTAGQLWIKRAGRRQFERLIETGGNLSRPMWIGRRIYFLSDHEGIGNLYSCTPSGRELRRHTKHEDFYVRHPSTDGKHIVYHAGADLWIFDTGSGKGRRVKVDFRSPRTQRNRKFVSAARYLENYAPHPKGHSVALTARGKAFSMANWEGAVVQHGKPDGARYRLAQWLPDGKRLVAVTDESGEDSLVLFNAEGKTPPKHLGALPIGRVIEMAVSPRKNQLALSNHRFELLLVDLTRRTVRTLDRSRHARIRGLAWSPDGRWLAYGYQQAPHQGVLRLCDAVKRKPHTITEAVLQDLAPSFDPEGKYLYFLSYREFDPVYDSMHFDLGFPRGMRPYLVTLQKNVRSPFLPVVKEPESKKKDDKKAKKRKKTIPALELDGIEQRVVAFPVAEGRYGQLRGIEGGALFSSYPVEGSLGMQWFPGEPAAKGVLHFYKFEDRRSETVLEGLSDFEVSADAETLFYRARNRLRALKAGPKPEEKAEREAPSPRSGWINLDRVKVSVDPGAEWSQMFAEAWRLMRDHFWVEDMSGIDWKKVFKRYHPLVSRVATRSEFSDLVWETQGELGTSHCYEVGGDYRQPPRYDVGMLGADFQYDPQTDSYRITRIIRGDSWREEAASPLATPGSRIKEGDRLVAINGRRVERYVPPPELLVNLARQEVTLTLQGGRRVTVKTLREEYPSRYREWVNRNRAWVHKRSRGRAGYVHIPDMGPLGYSEFHRQFLVEVDRDALLIDVRFNGGGHVSPLLLEKLARKRVGYDVQRWGQPEPYPFESPAGPLVALTNEEAGSDGDIFSHCFKLFGLGPLVGKRTWGGVVGIWPRHPLSDGSVTTQPEFSFWFQDVGFGVENYGTDPDVEVDIAPHEHAAGKDPQLERSLELLLDLLKQKPAKLPSFEPRPRLTLPRLPRK